MKIGYRDKKNVVNQMQVKNIDGSYDLAIGNTNYNLLVEGSLKKPKATIKLGNNKLRSSIVYKNNWVTMLIKDQDSTKKQFTRLTATLDEKSKTWMGNVILPNGQRSDFKIDKKENKTSKIEKKKTSKPEKPKVLPILYPNKAYGAVTPPKAQNVLFKNATVWTNEADGIFKGNRCAYPKWKNCCHW